MSEVKVGQIRKYGDNVIYEISQILPNGNVLLTAIKGEVSSTCYPVEDVESDPLISSLEKELL